MKKKLVLFDIDGTLVSTNESSLFEWKRRLGLLFAELYGVRLINVSTRSINGLVDPQMFRKVAHSIGLSERRVEADIEKIFTLFHKNLQEAVNDKTIQFFAIAEAQKLLDFLMKRKGEIAVGVISGNIEKNGWLKLSAANIREYFKFGAFADNMSDRQALVRHAIDSANLFFDQTFALENIFVIGDTEHDIIAGKAHGVNTIGVASGLTHTKEELIEAGADLAVSSLSDPLVLDILMH